MGKITPFLWFDGRAEEAMDFYLSIFPDSRELSRSPVSVAFELNGQRFIGLNAGPQHKFNQAVSFYIDCADQAEVDYYWDRLLADGGTEDRCGWLQDKFGLSWQVIPACLGRVLQDPRGLQAMLGMKKLIVAELESAVAG